ncbi:MAG: 30S ribosomal protein S13 [Candidatus Bathyarchaeota archaeon]|nr:MAG: 30S ribosomal protein S13 [Candidatus Bathyarchaeota archaeon]
MSREFRHIIRIADTDIDGTLKVGYGLSNIKGIGTRLAHTILRKANIDPETRLGLLSESDIEKLKDTIANLEKYGVPGWLLNRPKDIETGEDLHLIGPDLDLRIKSDIEELKKSKSWRGYRHAYKLKVRGQKTRTTGRKGKAMGVKKRALMRRGAK